MRSMENVRAPGRARFVVVFIAPSPCAAMPCEQDVRGYGGGGGALMPSRLRLSRRSQAHANLTAVP